MPSMGEGKVGVIKFHSPSLNPSHEGRGRRCGLPTKNPDEPLFKRKVRR